MDARFNMFDEIATKFGKRFANAGLVIQQSSLPKSTQELVSLHASQITSRLPGPCPRTRRVRSGCRQR